MRVIPSFRKAREIAMSAAIDAQALAQFLERGIGLLADQLAESLQIGRPRAGGRPRHGAWVRTDPVSRRRRNSRTMKDESGNGDVARAETGT